MPIDPCDPKRFTENLIPELAGERLGPLSAVLAGIHRIFEKSLACQTEEELGRMCLTVAEALTASPFSFMGKFSDQGGLSDIAISDAGWQNCRMLKPDGHCIAPAGFSPRSICQRVLREGKGFYTNTPTSPPERVGVPAGHPPLNAFLGAPLIHGGKVIGLVGVANRPGGYRDADLATLEMLAPAVVQALRTKRAEASLRENQSRLEAVLDAIPHAIVEFDANLKAVRANRVALEGAGYASLDFTRDQAVSRLKYQNLDGSAIRHEDLPVSKALGGEKVAGDLYRVVTADGVQRVIAAYAAPLYRDGELDGVVAILNDISQRKRAEEALAKAKEQIEQTLNSITDGYYALDSEWRFVALNATGEKHFGRTAAELIGRNIWQLTKTTADSDIYRHFLRAREKGQPYHFEAHSRIRPGFWADMHLYPRNGLLEVYFKDISQRKQVEAALRKSEEHLRKVFENAAVGIAITDWEGDLQECNPAYCKLLGYSQEELRRIKLHSLLHPEDREAIRAEICRLKAGEQPFFDIQNRYRHKDGHSVWVRNFVSSLPDEMGRPAHLVALVNDITKSKKAKEMLRRLNKTLVERTSLAEQRAAEIRQLAVDLTRAEERERRRLAAVLHDDLQQMLAYLKLKLTFLQRGEGAGDNISDLNDLVDQCIDRCRNLSHELKLPALEKKGFCWGLLWLCRQMKEMHGLDVALQATKGIDVASPVLSSMLIRSVKELLFNVVKHSGEKSASVEAGVEGEHILISVKDAGKGADCGVLRKKQEDGAAFGLFSIGDRVRFLGGHMQIETQPGRGFCVSLKVPGEVFGLSEGRQLFPSAGTAP